MAFGEPNVPGALASAVKSQPHGQAGEYGSQEYLRRFPELAAPSERESNPARGYNDHPVDHKTNKVEHGGQDQDLNGNWPRFGSYKLWKKRQHEKSHFWIEQICKEALSKHIGHRIGR